MQREIMSAQTIQDLVPTASGRTIIVRSDLNVPLANEQVTDDGRIRASLPAITQLAEAGAKVVVLAHLGRPKGTFTPEFSLAPVSERMRELSNLHIVLADDVTGPSARQAADGLGAGQVLLVQNVRFDARETSGDDAQRHQFAQEIAALAGAEIGRAHV